MHQRQVVVHRPGVLGPHRRARLQQQRHQRVVGDVLARVHQRRRPCARPAPSPARRAPSPRRTSSARARSWSVAAGRSPADEVAARAETGGHAGSTRRASLSCWTIRESRATAGHGSSTRRRAGSRWPAGRSRSARGALITKYGPIRPTATAGSSRGDLRQRRGSPARRARSSVVTARGSQRRRPLRDDQLGLAGQELAERRARARRPRRAARRWSGSASRSSCGVTGRSARVISNM